MTPSPTWRGVVDFILPVHAKVGRFLLYHFSHDRLERIILNGVTGNRVCQLALKMGLDEVLPFRGKCGVRLGVISEPLSFRTPNVGCGRASPDSEYSAKELKNEGPKHPKCSVSSEVKAQSPFAVPYCTENEEEN